MKQIRLNLVAVLSALALVACGGGGGSEGGRPLDGTPQSALPTLITASAIVDVNSDGRNDVIIGS